MSVSDPIKPLLERVSLGDRDAFSLLYDRTSAKLFGVCLRILQDRGEAEEALQDCFVKVWRSASRYAQSQASAMAWLVAVARNAAIDRYRARKRAGESLEAAESVADETPSPEADLSLAEEHRKLAECLEALGGEKARAIRAAFFGGQTYEELARATGTPLGTMKSWIRRGLMQLRSCLEA